MVRALKNWCYEDSNPLVGDPEHLVFLLIDGLGERWLHDFGAGSFLSRHQVDSLSAVYPSTTTVALTTLATAEPPSHHGMPGWWTYLSERNLSTTPLPFVKRFGGSSLPVEAEEMWPLRAWMADSEVSTLVITPSDYNDSVFTRYLSGGRECRGYSEPDECQGLTTFFQASHAKSFTYIYWPQFDSACHSFGCESDETASVFNRLDTLAERLANGLTSRGRLIVTADHGLLDIKENARHILREGDPILDCLSAPPSGEPRNPVFHLREGCRERFPALFEERFSDDFELVPTERLEPLLGGSLSSTAKQRFGDFVGVALAPAVLHYRAHGATAKPEFIGYHGGLTPQEMRVPLIIANGRSN